ncbi:MAG: PAS domain S-box protein, partial [Roseimicrobium sp.]
LSMTTILELVMIPDMAAWQGAMEELRSVGAKIIQGQHRRKDGSTYPVEVSLKYIRMQRDYLVAVVRDVTERQLAEKRVETFATLGRRLNATSQAREAAQIIVTVADELFGWDSCSLELYDAGGRRCHSILRMDTIHGKRQEVTAESAADVSTNGSHHVAMNGNELFPTSVLKAPLRDGQKVVGVLTIKSHRTKAYTANDGEALQALADHCAGALERIEGRAEQEKERHLLRTLIENIPRYIFVKDRAGRYLISNLAHASFLGAKDESELIGKTAYDFFPAEVAQEFESSDMELMKEGEPMLDHESFSDSNGHRRWYSITKVPFRDSAGKIVGVIGIKEDITRRKLMDESLRVSEERFREMAETIQDVFWSTTPDSKQVLYISPLYEKLWGRPVAELTANPASWMEAIVPDDRQRVCDALGHLAQGTPYDIEYRIYRPDGKERWIHDRGFPVLNASGEVHRLVGTAGDITDRKKVEMQFLRAQRMEGIGTLAGGIAHDLNNVLTPITMSIDLLRLRVKDAKCLEVLDTIAVSARRGADMVGQVLSFARGTGGTRVEVQVKHLIRDIEKIAQDTFPKSIEVRTVMGRDLWTLQGDPTQLHQVLLNLCVNARDAMPQGGRVTISATNVMIDEHYSAMNAESTAGPHVLIQVEDTGTGIPKHVVEKIFDPFFTTKELGKGTGLGLSTSLSIVKSHGGFIRVYTEAGVGTGFRIYLPAKTEADSPDASDREADLPRGNGETVLVVDDESSVRQVTKQTLEAFGYSVLLAVDGAEAVAIYAQKQESIDVALVDMAMPVMDGAATIKVLTKLNPSIRIVAASGIAANTGLARAGELAATYFVQKPYTADILLKMLRKVLQEKSL